MPLYLPPEWSPEWSQDILGPDFHTATMPLGDDPDGETDIYATVVRYSPTDAHRLHNRPAMLFVHGMSDYFFHRHVAEFFYQCGWAVYAIDLRKCGRSWRPGQRWHHTTDVAQYFEELTSALAYLSEMHNTVVIQGHSTGGLVVALWLDHLRHSAPELHAHIAGAILNSPWLDMMVPKPVSETLKPVLRWAGARWPDVSMPAGNLTAYGKSVSAEHYGEWVIDPEMKPLSGHQKNIGWLRAIIRGQDVIHSGTTDCGVPLLVLCSMESRSGRKYSPKVDTADVILDVRQIQHWAPTLSSDVTVSPIPDARHDVYLSQPAVRDAALNRVEQWLASIGYSN